MSLNFLELRRYMCLFFKLINFLTYHKTRILVSFHVIWATGINWTSTIFWNFHNDILFINILFSLFRNVSLFKIFFLLTYLRSICVFPYIISIAQACNMLKIVYFNPDNSRGKYMKPPTKLKLNMEWKPEASPKLILP